MDTNIASLVFTQISSDACPPRCRASWVGSIHRDVFMLCLAMYAFLLKLSILTVLSVILQSLQCRVRTVNLLHLDFISHGRRLRHQQQTHPFYINAKPLQPHLPRRRARDVPNPRCMFPCVPRSCQPLISSHSGSKLALFPGPPLLVDSFAGP